MRATSRTVCGVGVAAAALGLVGGAVASKPKVGPPPPKLYGIVGPTNELSLKTQKGQTVVKLKAGWYTLTISDSTSKASFALKGPGINRRTASGFVGAAIWGVDLRKGTYRYESVGSPSKSHTFKVT